MKKSFITVSDLMDIMAIEKMFITTLEELIAAGVKIGFLKDNRDLTPSNVKGKMASIKEEGVITPLHLIPASVAIAEGLEVIDEHGSLITVENAENVFVITDGNNRYKALMKLREKPDEAGKGNDPVKVMIDSEMKDVLKKVIEINNTSVKCKGKVYIKTALNQHKGNEALEFIKDCQDKKYSDSTISLITCFNLNLSKAIPLLVTDISKLPSSCNIDRAKKFVETARAVGYTDKYIAKRYLIQAVIDLVAAEHRSDDIFAAMQKMTETEVKFSMDNNYFDVIAKYLNN